MSGKVTACGSNERVVRFDIKISLQLSHISRGSDSYPISKECTIYWQLIASVMATLTKCSGKNVTVAFSK